MHSVTIYFFAVIRYRPGNYDETYDIISQIIYEVIMRKFRASMEPFWDLKFSEIILYRVSCACIQRIPF